MKKNFLYPLVMILVIVILIWEQTKINPNIWIQVTGVLIFFYGMSKLSAKTPSKNNENQK